MTFPPRAAPTQAPDWPAGRAWDRGESLLLLAILVTGVCLGWALRFPAVLTGGDDTTYLLLARSISTGAYRDIFLLGEPLHAQYPPGMPVWAWLFTRVLGGGIATIQALHLLLLALTAGLSADAVRRLRFPRLGLTVAGLVMFNPTLLGLAGTALSEILYGSLATLAVYAMLRADHSEDHRRARWLVVATLAALAAFLTRSLGVALVGTVLSILLVRGRWRAAGGVALAGGLVTGGWFGYVRHAARTTIGHSYLADLSATPPSPAMGGLPGRILENAQFYILTGLPDLMALFMVPKTVLDSVAWTALLGSAGMFGAIWLVRRWPAAPGLLVGTALILLLWPWGISRLAAPLVPLGTTSIVIGAMVIGRRWGGPRLATATTLTVVAALGISFAHRLSSQWTIMRECPRADTYGTASACTTPAERALVAGARAAGTQLPASAIIATSKEPVVYWFSGRRTVPIELLEATTPSALIETMRRIGVTHVLLSRMHPVEYRDLAATFAGACRDLTPVTPLPGPAALLAPRAPDDPDACAAIAQVLSWPTPAP